MRPRNQQVIREWRVLRELEGRVGKTLDELASIAGVSMRTIRRDLDVLQEAGFPIIDQRTDSGRRWRVCDWRKEAA